MSSISARLLAASLPVAFALLALDASLRRVRPVAWFGDHVIPASILLIAWCCGLAAAIALGVWTLSVGSSRLTRWGARGAPIAVALGGMLFAASLLDTARWAFTGPQARDGWMGTWGPVIALGVAAGGGGAAISLARWAELRNRSRRGALSTVVAMTFLCGAAALEGIDRRVYVGLYERIHRALEFVATLLALGAVALLLGPATRKSRAARGAVWVSASAGLAFLLAVGLSPVARRGLERDLRHVGADGALLGRTVDRMKQYETLLRGEDGELGMAKERIDELLDRYGVPSATRDPRWSEPLREPRAVAELAANLRNEERRPSVIVFYVDTLRRDVAYDPELMPNLAEFARSGLKFDRAYTAGSDTLTALPAILGGHYDLRRIDDPEHDEDAATTEATTSPARRSTILDVARSQGVPTTLFIGESAFEFLDKLLPSFHFDQVERTRDYEKAGVWGYGAEQPTSDAVVTRALDWMHDNKDKGPFFSWLFNFDVHNWRELDARYIAATARRFDMPEDGPRVDRYKIATRAVDAAFGRLIEGLREMDLENDVVVLFVSDHGEALGEDDFWVHSVFVWESLVRVPLVLRAPGLPPGVVDDQVSVVDIAPTLARYLHPAPSMVGFHGEDLVTYAGGDRPRRRLPLLLSSVNERRLSRVGLVDGRFKLVLRTDWGEPQLFDLEADKPDQNDVSAERPAETTERMSALLRSPVFVNAYEDAKAKAAADKEP